MDIVLKKVDKFAEFWPYLLSESGPASRPPWLKFDFDRWQDEDDEDEEHSERDEDKSLYDGGAMEVVIFKKLKKCYTNYWFRMSTKS